MRKIFNRSPAKMWDGDLTMIDSDCIKLDDIDRTILKAMEGSSDFMKIDTIISRVSAMGCSTISIYNLQDRLQILKEKCECVEMTDESRSGIEAKLTAYGRHYLVDYIKKHHKEDL